VMFVEDPELPSQESANGKFEFIQVVGITLDELQAISGWDTRAFAEVLSAKNPLMVTDVSRTSILNDPEVASIVQTRTKQEGSSMGSVFSDRFSWEINEQLAEVSIGAKEVLNFGRMLRGRLPFDKPFNFIGSETMAVFRPGPEAAWTLEDGTLVIDIPPDRVEELGSIEGKRGSHEWSWFEGFKLHVVPSEILDRDGNVVETIG